MADFHLRTFPYAGLAVPSESPFFPVIMNIGGERKVKFNQGYVLDYQASFFNLDSSSEKIIIHKVEGMELAYALGPENKKYIVSIIVDEEGNKIVSATFKEADGEPEGENEYFFKVCEINGDGSIIEIHLRENIHWQRVIPKPPSEAAPETPFFLGYDGSSLKWFESEPCEEDSPP